MARLNKLDGKFILLGLAPVGLGVFAYAPWGGSRPPSRQPVHVAFEARVGDEPFQVGQTYRLDGEDALVTPTDLRFFIHDVRLITKESKEVAVRLDRDDRWQAGGVAMLDFEDGSAATHGSEPRRTVITGVAPDDEYRGLRFLIGVPFERNHADPARASGPLAQTSMHWNWQGGYKFLRLEAVTEEGESLLLHLGSTGCEGTIADVSGCARSNRPEVRLDGFDPKRNTVVFDVAPVLRAMLEASRASGDGRCMASAQDVDCDGPFDELGLDVSTGEVEKFARGFHIR